MGSNRDGKSRLQATEMRVLRKIAGVARLDQFKFGTRL